MVNKITSFNKQPTGRINTKNFHEFTRGFMVLKENITIIRHFSKTYPPSRVLSLVCSTRNKRGVQCRKVRKYQASSPFFSCHFSQCSLTWIMLAILSLPLHDYSGCDSRLHSVHEFETRVSFKRRVHDWDSFGGWHPLKQ